MNSVNGNEQGSVRTLSQLKELRVRKMVVMVTAVYVACNVPVVPMTVFNIINFVSYGQMNTFSKTLWSLLYTAFVVNASATF